MDEPGRRGSPDPVARGGSPRARRPPLRSRLVIYLRSISGGGLTPSGGSKRGPERTPGTLPLTPQRSRRATVGEQFRAGLSRWRRRFGGAPAFPGGGPAEAPREEAPPIQAPAGSAHDHAPPEPPAGDPPQWPAPARVQTPNARVRLATRRSRLGAPRAPGPGAAGPDDAPPESPRPRGREGSPAPGLGRPPLRPPSGSGGALVRPPAPPAYIMRMSHTARVQAPLFEVNPEMHFTTFDVPGTRSFGGSGGYGDVELLREHGLAVKTVKDREWFRVELVATLLVGDCALRARRALGLGGVITPLAFSLAKQQVVFRAYDMDMSHYIGQLAAARARHPLVPRYIERRFAEMARAVSYLNTSCGLTHLDIKGANILVNLEADGLCLGRAVLADFSLLTLNTNAVAVGARFSVWCPERGGPVTFGTPWALTAANFHTLVGHGYNQPPELLIKYVNNERSEFVDRPLDHDCGLATDLYALGQVLLELLLTAYVAPDLGVPLARVPGYQYFNNELSPDFAIAVLAYRCHLHGALFPQTPETLLHGPPCDSPDVIRRRLRSSRHKRAFSARLHAFAVTHRAPLAAVALAPELRPLAVLVAVLCHANPRARSAAPAIWT
ncbi:tegument serine/threonine protein kinase [Ateline alphaherpesvirus 1]|uniref:Tegument serine/threonine protein kinase n=1 Tax=Herpesvirus ateles type 1 (strain Lennette) TaxID=35243 RepID=A0A1S6JLQ5_HSVA1|nr:tegument serine/threonine protein kinase [Ateline alphaherpesvirus 1]AQS79203.1 tegument serine/threonine protein kinase [Ateline alphaherpesvirus 1]